MARSNPSPLGGWAASSKQSLLSIHCADSEPIGPISGQRHWAIMRVEGRRPFGGAAPHVFTRRGGGGWGRGSSQISVARPPSRSASGDVCSERRDVDPLHCTVTVERQANELTGPGPVLTPPKSEAGRRTVALPAFCLHALEHHLQDYVGGGRFLRLHSAHRAPAPPTGSVPRLDGGLCGCRDRRRAAPRSPAPCRHRDRAQSQRRHARARGNHRPLVARGRRPVPARHRRAQQGNLRLSRSCDLCCDGSKSSVAVRIRA